MRYLIISDIHANLTALETVLRDAKLDTIDEVWCLGDIIGYGPDPNECVARMKELATHCLVGNHDHAALDLIDISDFNLDARQAVMWTREHLTAETKEFLEKLPPMIPNATQGDPVAERFTLAHGSPRYPIWEYLIRPLEAAENFEHFETQFCLVGHTHQPIIFRQEVGDSDVQVVHAAVGVPLPIAQVSDVRFIINPGSVGQPRDGDPRASYAIYDTDKGALTYHRVAYDIAETQKRMSAAGLPERLIGRLDYGW